MKKFEDFLIENNNDILNNEKLITFLKSYHVRISYEIKNLYEFLLSDQKIIKISVKNDFVNLYTLTLKESIVLMDSEYYLEEDKYYKWYKINCDFNCCFNGLTSLNEYTCPRIISENFYCSSNQLTSLENGPEIIKESLHCNNNQLTSLKGCPRQLIALYCNNNPLKDLSGIPYLSLSVFDFDRYDELNITLENNFLLMKLDKTHKVNWCIKTNSEEELQLHAIKVNPENIKKIQNILNSVIEIIKRDYPEYIRYLPRNKQTKLTDYGL